MQKLWIGERLTRDLILCTTIMLSTILMAQVPGRKRSNVPLNFSWELASSYSSIFPAFWSIKARSTMLCLECTSIKEQCVTHSYIACKNMLEQYSLFL
jgi:hypothetical protein